jgi:hypothetical protein
LGVMGRLRVIWKVGSHKDETTRTEEDKKLCA